MSKTFTCVSYVFLIMITLIHGLWWICVLLQVNPMWLVDGALKIQEQTFISKLQHFVVPVNLWNFCTLKIQA